MNKFESKYYVESQRHMRAVGELVLEHPEMRNHVCAAILGEAIAVCDSFGYDAEAFIAHLRSNTTKPAVLSPPDEEQS